VRIIAATNCDLEKEVEKGRFRSDLFYRLRVAVLSIPPLRERREDIMPLAHYFMSKYAAKYKKDLRFGPGIEAVFLNHRWPGNVREMENLIESQVVTCERSTIEAADLSGCMRSECADPKPSLYESLNTRDRSLKDIMQDIEREIINGALQVHGSMAKVADILKVDRSTIFRKLKRDDPS
jgi:transcriptional regulator with PAS, ATPase and Fis domain